jgi:ubiquitin-protein ligase
MSSQPKISMMSQVALRRIINDIKQLNKNPLTSQGIYYHHDDSNVSKGYAMIVGPEDTPYEHGYYFFEFTFPDNYPFAPPVVISCTQDGLTRFNPNMYVTGKVCLSILNTWTGDQWSSCQTISSVLLVLCTTLCKNPLTNEPNVAANDPRCDDYNKIIEYKNMEIAILKLMIRRKEYLSKPFCNFFPIMDELFIKNKEKIINKISERLNENGTTYNVSNYVLKVKVNYTGLFQNYLDYCDTLK